MIYNISAMVVYHEQIEAETEEEARDIFAAECPYDDDDIVSIACECGGEE